jgi:hypothetical protein
VIKTIAHCIVLGMATTVAVAWGCALVEPQFDERWNWSHRYGMGDTWSYWMGEAFGTVKIVRASSRGVVAYGLVARDVISQRGKQPPRWSSVHQPPLERELNARGTWMEDARGWPFVCMMSRHAALDGKRHITCCIQVTGPPHYLTLPLMPIVSGFAANAAIFGTGWACVIAVSRMARRSIRFKRGCCTSCGYDRRYSPDTPCPECGTV